MAPKKITPKVQMITNVPPRGKCEKHGEHTEFVIRRKKSGKGFWSCCKCEGEK
jgi:hypothetical protein